MTIELSKELTITWSDFVEIINKIPDTVIVEMGTKRSKINMKNGTIHRNEFNNYKRYIGTDFMEGIDVDIIADAHKFSKVFGIEKIDAIISCSVYEHLKYPQLASHEILKSLKIGGKLYIQTHNCFPIHAYPYDYYRYTIESLASLFDKNMGFNIISSYYEFPAKIVSDQDPNTQYYKAFLNVYLYGEKIDKTPNDFIYDLKGSLQ